MNIAIFASAFYPHFGGVEELVRQLAHEQLRRGHRPAIFTNRWPKDLPAAEEFEGLPVRRYVFRVPEHTWRQMGGAILFGPGTLRAVCRDLRAAATDVIHVQCVSSNAYYALHAKRRLGLPLVVTLQGELTMDASRLYQRSRFVRGLLREVLDEAEVITGCSRKTLADAEQFYGKPFGDRGRVIFNAANLADFDHHPPIQRERPYILGIGRLVPQKGFDVLLRAFARADVAGHDLLLAGDGSERPALEAMARDLGIGDRVHFPGRADRPQVVGLLRGASFFVIPSRADEGLPVVCAEAMAAGKAIVGTRVGGVPEAVVEGQTGLLVEREDVEALAGAVQRLAADMDLRERLAAAGRARASKFSWPVIEEEYRSAYELARESANQRAVAAGAVAGASR